MIETPESASAEPDVRIPVTRHLRMREFEMKLSRHVERFRDAGPVLQKPDAGIRMTGAGHDFLAAASAGRWPVFPKPGMTLQDGKHPVDPGRIVGLPNGVP